MILLFAFVLFSEAQRAPVAAPFSNELRFNKLPSGACCAARLQSLQQRAL